MSLSINVFCVIPKENLLRNSNAKRQRRLARLRKDVPFACLSHANECRLIPEQRTYPSQRRDFCPGCGVTTCVYIPMVAYMQHARGPIASCTSTNFNVFKAVFESLDEQQPTAMCESRLWVNEFSHRAEENGSSHARGGVDARSCKEPVEVRE
ncbi:hypothetical protein OUZ56_021957 [Daphnia magna]|uniref:Uncharacterized protein n=1 Tax=Daphnia magna TaxID=35525 RepID=A0ABR0AUY5_9CRUS|nr:hypothetical protein OUZ56_021957 [Daphnia magna]